MRSSCSECQIVTVASLWTLREGQPFIRKYTKNSANFTYTSENHLTRKKISVQLIWKHKLYVLLPILETKQSHASGVSSFKFCIHFVLDVEKITLVFPPKTYVLDFRAFSNWLQSLRCIVVWHID